MSLEDLNKEQLLAVKDFLECIIDHSFSAIIKNNFIRNRTVNHILKPGHFKNAQGKRYAKNASYELKLKNTRKKIIKQTNIIYLQDILKNLKETQSKIL